jgi:dienelactone hydrolase
MENNSLHRYATKIAGLAFYSLLVILSAAAQSQPKETVTVDRRLIEICDLNKTYSFTPFLTKQDWLDRAEHLRNQILASAGLLPMPPKPALNARIFGRIERDGYSVEKAYFESHPGFFVTGNLYKPRGKAGPFPAIVSPHGHWNYGRLENTDLCSGPGRAINFARQGYIVFTYDMIGYNDSTQLSHTFGGQREELWGISLAGLQLWNSIRAVDFLISLPEVDKDRLGATGESGGGTQTFLLMAVDDRIKVGAPVNMVSAHMQGGCLCENAPGLRLDTFNVELTALAAPRPLLLVSATGDWTRNMLRVEHPAIRSIYKLFDAEDQVEAVQIDAPHNYNKASREAVYAWFGRSLLNAGDAGKLKEKSFSVEKLPELLVFYGIERPAGAVSPEQLTAYLIGSAQSRLDSIKPRDDSGVKEFRRLMAPALEQALAANLPAGADLEVLNHSRMKGSGFTTERFFLTRKNRGDRVPATLWIPARMSEDRVATLVVTEDAGLSGPTRDAPGALVSALLKSGQIVLSIDCFQTGKAMGPRPAPVKYSTTYNRTDLANRVQDILTAVAYLRSRDDVIRVDLAGEGKAGLWCLLARGLAPEIGRTAVDVAGFDNVADEGYLAELFSPGLRRVGDFRTAMALALPGRLLIHNTNDRFRTQWIEDVYRSLGRGGALKVTRDKMPATGIAEWLRQ